MPVGETKEGVAGCIRVGPLKGYGFSSGGRIAVLIFRQIIGMESVVEVDSLSDSGRANSR